MNAFCGLKRHLHIGACLFILWGGNLSQPASSSLPQITMVMWGGGGERSQLQSDAVGGTDARELSVPQSGIVSECSDPAHQATASIIGAGGQGIRGSRLGWFMLTWRCCRCTRLICSKR